MDRQTVLVVDDQPEILEPVRSFLEAEGFHVVTAADGLDAFAVFRENHPALVVLDLMLPEVDGLAVCRRIRSESDVPILVLTAKAEEADVVAGLEAGADDYLVKPFRVRELLARIRALLRRPRAAGQESVLLRTRRLQLDPASGEVSVDGNPVKLTPMEFRLLAELMRHPGRVMSRDALMNTIWEYDGYDLNLVTTHVKRLREKIEPDAAHPEIITTVRGFGYRLED